MSSQVVIAKPIDVESNEDIRLIGGWASVEIVDKQGQVVPIEELEKALVRYSIRGAPLNYGHKNHQVGKVVNWHIFKHPETGKWGVYIFAIIFTGEPIYDIVWDAIKKGKLTGFSIAGLAGKTEIQLMKENGVSKKAEILRDITITEISIVERPANQLAVIEKVNTFAKGDDVDDRVLNVMKSNYVTGLLDDVYDELVASFGKVFADKAINVFESNLEKFIKDIIVGSGNIFSKEVSEKNVGGNVLAIFEDEYEAAKYALSHYGFVVPTIEGTFAVVSFKEKNNEVNPNVNVVNDMEGLEGLEGLGELGMKKENENVDVDEEIEHVRDKGKLVATFDEKEDAEKYAKENGYDVFPTRSGKWAVVNVKKDDGVVASDSGLGYANPVYGSKIEPKKDNDGVDENEDSDEHVDKIKEGIRSVLDLFKKGDVDVAISNMIREGLKEELDAIQKYEVMAMRLKELGFDSLAEQILSVVEDEKRHIGEFMEMLGDVSPDDKEFIEEGAEKGGEQNMENTEEVVISMSEESRKKENDVVEEEKEVSKKDIESEEDLKRILMGILDEAKKVKGFVDNHSDSGAYRGMAEDVIKTIEALLGEINRGKIDVEKADSGIGEVIEKRGEKKRCMEKYYNFEEGHFKGRAGTGERFENCVRAQMECNGKSREEAEAICGKIARMKGYPKKKGEAPDLERLENISKQVDDIIKEIEKAKAKKKSACLKRYRESDGRFKKMTCPDNPGHKSRFCGCVRAQMECNGKSLEEAKKICSYINREVKKMNEINMKVVNSELTVLEKKIKDIKKKKKSDSERKNDREGKQEKRGRPKDKCRAKYVTPDGKYKKMSDPRHPKKPISEFWGCVRYYMDCKKKSYEDAKNICGKARYEAMSGGGEQTKATRSGRE